MEIISVVTWYFIFVNLAGVRGMSDEEIHRLPKLFHLDDYDRCLSREDGLYCVGTFELAPESENSTLYSIIEEHQKENTFSFNRRLLHRGYCLSTRCPSKELNSTLRFEECANKQLSKYALTARLKKLSYCRNPTERKARVTQAPDWPQRIFLYVAYFILVMNVLGTIYDVCADGKKNNMLVAWSLPSNWKLLTGTNDDSSTSFIPMDSYKILTHLIVIFAHTALSHYLTYVYNPETLEKLGSSPTILTIRNSSSLVQIFLLISSFLTANKILVTAKRSAVDSTLMLKSVLKRIFRIAPVYLLLTGYAATWWPRASDGPVWTTIVETESAVCRRKFWTHMLFVNNLVEATDLCFVQSWAIAVEIQLFLVSLLLTVLFIKLRVRAAPVLGVMLLTSCVFNVTAAYAAGFTTIAQILVPENLRAYFRGCQSFFFLHMSPWSHLPPCLFGLLLAHMYFEKIQNKVKTKIEEPDENDKRINENDRLISESKKEESELDNKGNELRNRNNLTGDVETDGVDNITKLNKRHQKINEVHLDENKSIKNTIGNQNASKSMEQVKIRKERKAVFLLRNAHCFTLPSIMTWIVLGAYMEEVDSKFIIALYVGMEGPVLSALCAWQMLQIITLKGPWSKLMSWRGWTVPSRLFFSVVMVHWCINITIVAARPQPVVSSVLDISIDWMATTFYSVLAALPVSLLIEMPMKKIGDVILS